MTKAKKPDAWTTDISDAFEVARELLREPGAFPDDFVILPSDAAEVARITTPERLRILQKLVESGGYRSVDELANDLHRHQSRVSRDLSALQKTGVVRTRREGQRTRIEATAPRVVISLRDLAVRPAPTTTKPARKAPKRRAARPQ
jgi:predicted transcriptional regulator